ncbi:MAG: AcrR family transcriptional regulator [Oleispira sp.]|jgi:AcrR family transcriptional regulator
MAEKELDKRVERSRRLLINALLELMKDCPYNKISVAHIAEKSGVARPTFYLHFHSKDDLLISHIDEMFERFYAEIDGYITQRKDADPVIATIMFRQWSDNAEFARLLVQTDIDSLMLSQFKNYIERVVERFMTAHNVPNKAGLLPYVVDFLAGASFMVIKRWVLKGLVETPEVMGELYASLVRPGLLAVLLGGYL